jgi:hypothetical protein
LSEVSSKKKGLIWYLYLSFYLGSGFIFHRISSYGSFLDMISFRVHVLCVVGLHVFVLICISIPQCRGSFLWEFFLRNWYTEYFRPATLYRYRNPTVRCAINTGNLFNAIVSLNCI